MKNMRLFLFLSIVLISNLVFCMVEYNSHETTPQETDAQYISEMPIEDTMTIKTYATNNNNISNDDVDTFEQDKKTAIKFIVQEDFADPDSQKFGIGYFWDNKNRDDRLQYPGIARIGQERFNNIEVVDAMKPNNPGYLVYLGKYVQKSDGKMKYLYGHYSNTLIPIHVSGDKPDPQDLSIESYGAAAAALMR